MTKYVKELREKSVKKNGTASLFDERKKFNKIFVENHIKEKDIKSMIKQIQPIYENAMKNKDYWLKINGDIFKEFRFKWFEQTNIPKIVKIEINPIQVKEIKPHFFNLLILFILSIFFEILPHD